MMSNVDIIQIKKKKIKGKKKNKKDTPDNVVKEYVEITPVIDLVENDQEFLIIIEVPGLKKKNIKVRLSANILTVKGKKKQKSLKNCQDKVTECIYGVFQRTITLPETVQTKKVFGRMNNGILTVKIPKKDYLIPVKVKVK